MRTLRPGPDLAFYLNHALHGLASEVGEIADTIKKHLIYGQQLNVENLKEEVGDLCWYIALLCYANNISLEEAMVENVAKLKRRYPEKFSEELAAKRLDKQ